MIDPIGMKPGAIHERRTARTDAVDSVTAAPDVTRNSSAAAAEADVRSIAREMAVSPPIDRERVQQIRQAIIDGRYPIVPATLADRLIAAQLDWLQK
jgi:negative regulator of flagellin synthesis FlgM